MPSKKAVDSAHSPPICLRCGTQTRLVSEKHGGLEVRAYKCPKCGWSMTHPEDANLVLMREKGMRASLGMLGRQTILRIPASIREMYKLGAAKEVLLKPVDRKRITLEVV